MRISRFDPSRSRTSSALRNVALAGGVLAAIGMSWSTAIAQPPESPAEGGIRNAEAPPGEPPGESMSPVDPHDPAVPAGAVRAYID